MATVTIRKAKAQLPKLIQRVLEGEDVITARGDEPLVKLVPLPEQPKTWRIGGVQGLVVYTADDFGAPLELCSSITL